MSNQNIHKEIHITDHALLRYLERIKGVDLESEKREMLTSNGVVDFIRNFRSGKIPIAPKTFYLVKDLSIVTVVFESDHKSTFRK